MNRCTIIYGLSGSLKMATLNSYLYEGDFKLYSDTKSFFDIDEKYFNWSSRPNDCHLAIHRLLSLKLIPRDVRNVAIERGVTDNLFCVPNRKLSGLEFYDNIDIKGLVDMESNLLSDFEVNRLLLVMKDEDFIKNTVLNGPDGRHRKAIYPDLETYISKQDEYVKFTKKWNKIDNTVVISNARGYIETILKLKYNE